MKWNYENYNVTLNSQLFSFYEFTVKRYTRRVGSVGKFAVMRGEPETKSPRVEEKEFAAGQEIARSPQGKISYVTCSMRT